MVKAAFNGDAVQVLSLLEAGADVDAMGRNWNPLHAAIENEQLEIVNILLKAGANPNDLNANGIELFPTLHHVIDVQMDGHHQTRAVELPSAELIKILVEAGADVCIKWKQKTPLQMAEQRGHENAAAYLLSLENEI